MSRINKQPKEFYLQPTEREDDDFMHLPLSQASPISVRLPVICHDWVKEQGAAWVRNVLTKAALQEMNLSDNED